MVKKYSFETTRDNEGQENLEIPCAFNDGASCKLKDKKCDTCGWNPDVAQARHKAMGIYPSVAELPTFGSYYGQLLYVYEGKQVYPYVWKGNRWKVVTT